jgi:uncharacterized protein YydD (DUF2326 family)
LAQICLAQLVSFLVVKLIYLDLNYIFNIDIIFMINYFLVVYDISIDNDTVSMTDFINLKIKKKDRSVGEAHGGDLR